METALAVIISVAVTVCIFIWYIRLLHTRYDKQIQELQEKQTTSQVRNTNTQRSVIKGQIVEQLYPLLRSCDYVSSDMRFFGNPIDYIVFEGLSDTRDTDQCTITSVVFIDVKTGNARLSREQLAIKKAIEEKKIRWETIRIS